MTFTFSMPRTIRFLLHVTPASGKALGLNSTCLLLPYRDMPLTVDCHDLHSMAHFSNEH